MAVTILMVEAGWRGLSGALAQMVSPVAASMTMKLLELTWPLTSPPTAAGAAAAVTAAGRLLAVFLATVFFPARVCLPAASAGVERVRPLFTVLAGGVLFFFAATAAGRVAPLFFLPTVGLADLAALSALARVAVFLAATVLAAGLTVTRAAFLTVAVRTAGSAAASSAAGCRRTTARKTVTTATSREGWAERCMGGPVVRVARYGKKSQKPKYAFSPVSSALPCFL